MSFIRILFSYCVLALVVYAQDLDKQVVFVNEDMKMNEVTMVIPHKAGLSDTYCCLKNGFGCVQECDSNIKYYCCLKNGLGSCQQMCDETKQHFCCLKNGFGSCQQLCENGHEYYCCKKNGLGSCVGMCPKTSNSLIQEVI